MAVQDYIDHVLNALPKWFSNRDRSFENVKAFAEIFQDAQDQSDFWRTQAAILTAVGATPGEPDWLSQHAVDRDTRRQENETDPALRDRIRTFPDALNLVTLQDTVQSIVDAEGIIGTSELYELRPNRAFFAPLLVQGGTGGTFTGTAPDMFFQPDAGFQKLNPKYDGVTSHVLSIFSAASGGNDGGFVIDDIVGDSLAYQNGPGVAEVDAGAIWVIRKLDASFNALDGRQQAYLSRGYRLGTDVATLMVILPFGCTEATRLSVIEALRPKKGAGVKVIVECRENP